MMIELFRVEFMHSASCAGVACISRMSPQSYCGNVDRCCDIDKDKVTRISSHLLDWFQQPIIAKEMDVDALAGLNHVKRKYCNLYQITSQKGKKESGHDTKKW
jgi:hypothetical protein